MNLKKTDFFWILPLALVLGAGLSSLQPGNWWIGFASFSFLFLLSLTILQFSYRWASRAPEEHRDYPGTARQGRCSEPSGAKAPRSRSVAGLLDHRINRKSKIVNTCTWCKCRCRKSSIVNRMSRIHALVNQKGGVGKTTTAINLGAFLAYLGQRVLIVDIDPQANATACLGVDKRAVQFSTYDALLNGDVPASSILFNERLQLRQAVVLRLRFLEPVEVDTA